MILRAVKKKGCPQLKAPMRDEKCGRVALGREWRWICGNGMAVEKISWESFFILAGGSTVDES
jgi:hypothetical protein